MTSLLPRPKFTMADALEWLDRPWPFSDEHMVRIEESVSEDKYQVRAELPGFDPDKDIHVTAEGGMLNISAKRESHKTREGRSEFRYGSFSRSRSLPAGAKTDQITAKYDNGILEVSVPCAERSKSEEVPIEITKG